jgi:hypothetical protein
MLTGGKKAVLEKLLDGIYGGEKGSIWIRTLLILADLRSYASARAAVWPWASHAAN